MDSAQNAAAAIEYKKGYVMRKCCYDANYKKSVYSIHSSRRLKIRKFENNLSLFIHSSVWQTLLEDVLLHAERFSALFA